MAGIQAAEVNSKAVKGKGKEKVTAYRGSPPKKHARTTNNATRSTKLGGKASLKRIMDMPFEVFNEIASYLTPPDLLSLARSSKFFRHMLMSRSSILLWDIAFNNMPEIPQCPPELCEPQYTSLLFSKTCSNCGARALRLMDPYLLVRLCNSCRDKMICTIRTSDFKYDLVHKSDFIRESGNWFSWTLKSDLKLYKQKEFEEDEIGWSDWVDERTQDMEDSDRFGDRLNEYLKLAEKGRVIELGDSVAQRENHIKTRLLDSGWEEHDMVSSPSNVKPWNKLVLQPKPITDRIWTSLYPKLVAILKSNRRYHLRIDQEKRRANHIQRLDQILSDIRASLPPLIRVVLKEDRPGTLTGFDKVNYPDVTVEMPFPSTNEVLKWEMIGDMVEDTSQDKMEETFEGMRDMFNWEVIRWREKVERDMFNIWTAGQEDEFDHLRHESSINKTKVSEGMDSGPRRSGRRSKRACVHVAVSTSRTISTSADISLPQFTVIFTKPDNTTTTDITELPSTTQILLRADTMFRSSPLRTTYPGTTPVPSRFAMNYSTSVAISAKSGEEWQSSLVTRDEDGSAIATELLARLGKTGATSAEMMAIGPYWRCGRCDSGSDYHWEDLVSHYRAEQGKWKLAQEKLRERLDTPVTFNNTHDLGPDNNKLFVQLMTPSNSVQRTDSQCSALHMHRLTCLLCEKIGSFARYSHNDDSPMFQHLQDVHDIPTPMSGTHYQQWCDTDEP